MYDRQGSAGLKPHDITEAKVMLDWNIGELNTDKFHIFYEKDRIDQYTEPNKFDTCFYQRFVWAIGADQKVYPCCIMKYHPDYAYASIKENTLKEIVESRETDLAMTELDVSKCYPCWLRNRNKAIASAVEKPIHHNFI